MSKKGFAASTENVEHEESQSFSEESDSIDNDSLASSLSAKQSITPVLLICLLYMIWGFSGGMLESMNKYFQTALHLSKTQVSALSSMHFVAYLVGPPTYVSWFLKKYGHRRTIILGLLIHAFGAACFWPAAAKSSYSGFVAASFVLGSGISCLESAVMPFLVTCGPAKWAEIRYLTASSVSSSSTVVASLLSSFIIYKERSPMMAAQDAHAPTYASKSIEHSAIQYIYLAVACADASTALLFVFLRKWIPEVDDDELQKDCEKTAAVHGQWQDEPFRRQYTLFWGAAATFFWSAAQDPISNFFMNYCAEVRPGISDRASAQRLAIAQSLFAAGKMVSALLLRWIKPRLLLMGGSTVVIGLLVGAILGRGDVGISVLTVEYFFKACVMPVVYSSSLLGLGRHTKRGSGVLMASISGGAVLGPVVGFVADRRGVATAYAIPTGAICVAWSFALYLNLVRAKQIDSLKQATLFADVASGEVTVHEGQSASASAGASTPGSLDGTRSKQSCKGRREDEQEERCTLKGRRQQVVV